MRLDLHTHPLPQPGFLERLVDHAIKIGIDVIAITDFNNDGRYNFFREYAKVLSYYPTQRGFVVKGNEKTVKFIKGQEIPTKQGHILTIGATTTIQSNRTLEDTIKQAQDADSIIIADHPYVPKNIWGGIGEENLLKHLQKWHAIEWNAQCINLFPYPKFLMQAQANKKAEEFSKKYNIPLVADSDAHFTNILGFGGSLNQIGLAYITTQDFEYANDEQFIALLRTAIVCNQHKNTKRTNSKLGFLKWCIPLYLKDRSEHK